MRINNNQINIFDPVYTYGLCYSNPYMLPNVSVLSYAIENLPLNTSIYSDGEQIKEDIREYISFPKYIAVLSESNGKSTLQTFIGNKVCKFYDDIIANEADIRKFFIDSRGDIGVFDNNSAQQLTSDFDKFIVYISKLTEYREVLELQLQSLPLYMGKLERIRKNIRVFLDSQPDDCYDNCLSSVKSDLCEVYDSIDMINLDTDSFIKSYYTYLSEEHREAILYGLYYKAFAGFLRHNIDKNNAYHISLIRSLIPEFSAFITRYPAAFRHYCDYFQLSEKDTEVLFESMKTDNLTSLLD